MMDGGEEDKLLALGASESSGEKLSSGWLDNGYGGFGVVYIPHRTLLTHLSVFERSAGYGLGLERGTSANCSQ